MGRSTFNVKAAGNHDETPRAELPCQGNSKVDGMELRPGMPDPARGEAHAKQCHQTYGRYPQGNRRLHHIHPQNGSVTERYYLSFIAGRRSRTGRGDWHDQGHWNRSFAWKLEGVPPERLPISCRPSYRVRETRSRRGSLL